jgi:hypothetical protein
MTRQEMREIISQFISVTGWLCLGLAATSGLGLFLVQQPTRSKGGGPEAAYEIWTLFAVPSLIALSALLIFLAHRPGRSRVILAYWSLLAITLIPWLFALFDFMARGGGSGFQQTLKTLGLQ